jgi:TonB family protein
MRCGLVTCVLLILGCSALPQEPRPAPTEPNQFELGRHTFFDFGPPTDYYELFVVRPTVNGTSIERITLTLPGDECIAPAKLETASASISETISALLGSTNPCAIPEKALRRELKPCKKCLVFSGANVVMQVQCGERTRLIRSDILDKDMFDAAVNTPPATSWTMQLLGRLDQAVGPGVMDKPMFSTPETDEPSSRNLDSVILRDLSAGSYDALFRGAPDVPSDLYRAAQVRPALPSVRLISSTPFQPEAFVPPVYPPLARVTHIEGAVSLVIEIDSNGSLAKINFESGHAFLREPVREAVSSWRFPKEASNQQIHTTIEFKLNCPKRAP